jgi:hypothetical protein
LAQATAQAYNRLARTIRHLGTSDLAQGNKYLHPQNFNPLTDEDIDDIITKAYGISTEERRQAILERDKELATASVLSEGYPAHVKAALQILAETGTLSKFLNTAEAMGMSQSHASKVIARPRGNPVKGGLVKKHLDKGHTLEEANILAEQDLCRSENMRNSSRYDPYFDNNDFAKETNLQARPDIAAALAKVEADDKATPKVDKGEAMLNLLGPNLNKDTDFDDPENL